MGRANDYRYNGRSSDPEASLSVPEKEPAYYHEGPAVPGESFSYGNSTYAKIQRFAGKWNIEQRGIERVPENERTDTNQYKTGTMVSWLWISLRVWEGGEERGRIMVKVE